MTKRHLETNALGHLTFGGCDTVALAEKYGTPLYVMDGDLIESNMQACMQAMAQHFSSYKVFYASKAIITKAICKMVEKNGLHLDVVSAGELYVALQAGFPGERISMHGNVKTPQELEMAMTHRVTLIADSLDELGDIEAMAQKLGVRAKVMLRITPGIEAHTHEYIQTGTYDCKFAVGIIDGQAMEGVKAIIASPHMDLHGLHCHIGSQILSDEPYDPAGVRMAEFALEVEKETGVRVPEIVMGGGFGIHYAGDEIPQPIPAYIHKMADGLNRVYRQAGVPLPTISIEPGRRIVGEAGLTLYTIYTRKEKPGIRTFVSVDGGMADNPRVTLYQAEYEAVLAARPLAPAEETVRLSGRCCESGDVLIYDLEMPVAQKGEVLAVFATGAYNFSMASNYNKLPVPPVVLVSRGRDALMVRGQSLADMVRLDEIPAWVEED